MSPVRVFLAGAALIVAGLAAVLATDDFGVGAPPAGSASSEPFFPSVLEDDYDVRAYQQRGRWIASGATPYLQEHSEYPQVVTWLYGVPYLLFDHHVAPGTPYDTRARVRAWFLERGAPAGWFARLDDALEQNAGDPVAVLGKPAVAPLLEQAAELPGLDVAAAREHVLELAAAWHAYQLEVERDRASYADWHQVLMALWYLVLLYALIGILVELGRPPAYALLVFLPATFYFSFSRGDMIVSALFALTLLAWLRRRYATGGFWLGVATMAKWWPGFLGPLLALWAVREGRAERLAAGLPPRTGRLLVQRLVAPAAAALGVVAVVLGITYAWDGGGWPAVNYLFDWHLHHRLPNHASAYALLTEPDRLGWLGHADRGWLGQLFMALQLGVPFGLALLPIRDRDTLLKACLATALGMLLFQKFFSPQWVLWTTLLAIPLAARSRKYLVALVVAEVVIFVQLPLLYFHALAHVPDPSGFEPFWSFTYFRLALFAAYWSVVLADTIRSALRPPPAAPALRPRAPAAAA